MGDTGVFKSKESQGIYRQLATPSNQPIEEQKLLADRFLQIEGDVPKDESVLLHLVGVYYEYALEYDDMHNLQKAMKYASIGYNLCIKSGYKDDDSHTWYFNKYLGLSYFHAGNSAYFENALFHLKKAHEIHPDDPYVNSALNELSK